MFKVELNMSPLRYIFLMCFILFSLTPCLVKESIAEIFDINYEKPLSKSRTNLPLNFCQYSTLESKRFSVGQHQSDRKSVPVSVLFSRKVHLPTLAVCSDVLEIHSGNGPPIYILYKRLKVALV